jgi:hypothetical protein
MLLAVGDDPVAGQQAVVIGIRCSLTAPFHPTDEDLSVGTPTLVRRNCAQSMTEAHSSMVSVLIDSNLFLKRNLCRTPVY